MCVFVRNTSTVKRSKKTRIICEPPLERKNQERERQIVIESELHGNEEQECKEEGYQCDVDDR